MTLKYLVGADPELFVVNEANVFISGHGLVPGTKHAPFGVQRGAVQVDGMALEFNIDPSASRDEFVANVEAVRTQLDAMIAPLRTVCEPVAHFDQVYFRNQPPEALEMGCDPDYDAWALQQNNPPNANRPMRTAAGHVHLGWGAPREDVLSPEVFLDAAEKVRHLDCLVGLSTILLDPNKTRREMYGKAGAFRPKPYGLEYRVPSNFWVKDRQSIGWMYDALEYSMNMYDAGEVLNNPEVVDIINNSDAKRARALLPADFPMVA